VNRLLLDLVAIGERHGIRFPREFGLFVKQLLYFDRCAGKAVQGQLWQHSAFKLGLKIVPVDICCAQVAHTFAHEAS